MIEQEVRAIEDFRARRRDCRKRKRESKTARERQRKRGRDNEKATERMREIAENKESETDREWKERSAGEKFK